MIGSGDHPEGFEVRIHRALIEPILLGGAPRGAAIVNGTLAASLGLGLQQWLAGLILFLAGHSLCAIAGRRDPQFVPVLARHLRQKGHWSC